MLAVPSTMVSQSRLEPTYCLLNNCKDCCICFRQTHIDHNELENPDIWGGSCNIKEHGIKEPKKLAPKGAKRVSNSQCFTDEELEAPFLQLAEESPGLLSLAVVSLGHPEEGTPDGTLRGTANGQNANETGEGW